MYACYVDFEKAFDSVDRNLLSKKLSEDFHLGGKMLALINYILTQNNVYISVGNQTAKSVIQTKGVAQGDSLSPTLFLLYIADLPTLIRENTNAIEILMYADDLVLYSASTKDINIALSNLANFCDLNKIKVNLAKTKVMKFRNGGRLAKEDRFTYKGENVEIVNMYTYLGVTMQTKLTFTEHIINRKIQSIRAISSLRNLHRLTVENAHLLFQQKIKTIATYALQKISSLLTVTHMQELDKIKSYFIKRVLGVHKSASSTLCYQIIGWSTFVNDLRTEYVFNKDEMNKYDQIRNEKDWNFVAKNYTEGPAFTSSSWRQANQNNRSKICRATVHGFHHNLCDNTQVFHEPSEECVCKFCKNNCSHRYHILTCSAACRASVVN